MAVTFHCPHCGRDPIRMTRITWPVVFPCPYCKLPIRNTVGGFASNCMYFGMFWGTLVTLPVLLVNLILTQANEALAGKLFIGGFLAVIAGVAIGWLAWFIGLVVAGFRPTGPRLEERAMPEAPRWHPRPASSGRIVKCLHCDEVVDPVQTAGYCEQCGKKLPPRWID